MARDHCGNTAAVALNATAAVVFMASRRSAGGGKINKTDAHAAMPTAILPQSLALFR